MIEDLKFIQDLFINENKTPYALVSRGDRTEVYPVFSDEIHQLISQELYTQDGAAPNKTKREQIQSTMAAEGFQSGKVRDVWVRSASTESGIEIDLNNTAGECIQISNKGWEVGKAKSLFYRPAASRPLPRPVAGGSWELFKKHFKTRSDEDLRLIVGYMVSSLRPNGPYAIMVLQGEQGTAKSTTARMIKALVDPAMGATRSMPKKEQDVFISAKNNHLISFDNISNIKGDLSDTLCRLATGGSFACRALYTNDSEYLIELAKPIMLNGITDFVTRADLASRSIIVELATIPDGERKTENQVWNEFEADLPLMLGVLMDGLVSSFRNRETVKLEKLPRMADVAIWCTAAEEGLGWEKHSFVRAFENNQLNAVLNNLSTEPVSISLRSFMLGLEHDNWEGTATGLLTELDQHKPFLDNASSWPTTPAYLSQCLTRMAPSLRKVGINFAGKSRDSQQRQLILNKLSNFDEMNPKPRPEAKLKASPSYSHEANFDD